MSICSECGGQCCKRMPGAAMPEDFPDAESLRRALASGKWTVDWWEGDTETYYVRPAIKGFEGRRYHGGWIGECTFLGPRGCTLAWTERPAECRELVPSADGNCAPETPCDKRTCAVAWLARAAELE